MDSTYLDPYLNNVKPNINLIRGAIKNVRNYECRRINAKIQDKGYLETREGPDFQMFSKS